VQRRLSKQFQKLFKVLINGELREDYDRYGPEEESQSSQHMRQWQHEE
jgi:DnaJ-class molecular chaperone